MRSGSKEIPNKNLINLLGKPLMSYSIEQAIESELFEHIVVSTDSQDILHKAKCFGAEGWFIRPKTLSSDESPKIPVIRHALKESEKKYGHKFDIIFDLDVTSPLRFTKDIIDSYNQFTDEDADILITACPSRKNPYFNMVEYSNNQVQKIKELESFPNRRQDAPKVFDMNASIYIWKRDALMNNDTLFVTKTSLFVMPQERSIDIDTEMDLKFVNFLMDTSTN